MLTAGSVLAEQSFPTLAVANSPVENTSQNVRDSGDATLTPEDQKETKGDIKITAAIRRAVTRIESLSLDAHNAKIITRNGVVTLRGPVENQAEKDKLQKIAQKTRGVKQVDNQLETKTP
jgi:osmotically-inducible protein OsmY